MTHMQATIRAPAPAEHASDLELARRAAGGDDQAFECIMRRHNRLLFRSARSILRSDAEAEDALQEGYLRAWRAMAGFRADAKLSTWLVRIVINEALARLRQRGALVIPIDAAVDPSVSVEQAPADDEPERAAMRADIRRLMEDRIDLLPDVYRQVFILRAVEEMSVEEVAAALDIPQATVRTRLFRARGLLREGLSRDIDVAVGDAFSFDGERCNRIVGAVLSRISDERRRRELGGNAALRGSIE